MSRLSQVKVRQGPTIYSAPMNMITSLQSADRPGPLVLITDDDADVRDSLAAVMDAFGFRTRTAGNGFEALASIETECPAAIITDLHMPDMDGFELLTALRAAKCAVPVVAISGGVAKGYDFLRAAKRLGAAATFQKPLSVLDVVDTINILTVQPGVDGAAAR
jgi:CheY-like chemotaxis protein